MDKKEFNYEINGKTYTQRPLVLGQIKQITEVLKGIEFTSDMDVVKIVELLDDRLPEALAVILTEEGKKLRSKDVAALADEFRETVDIGTAMEIVDRFFSLNPIASVLEKLTGTIMGLTQVMMTGSIKQSLSSVGAISPEERKSFGDIPSENAILISKNDPAGDSSGKP